MTRPPAVVTSFDDALAALYRAPRDAFAAERKRLAGELRQKGDKPAAARLAKLPRPTLSAWAVNQLYWRSRPLLDELLAGAERIRAGDLGAAAPHRETLARLRAKAEERLRREGSAATEVTLRRVTSTLSALAAAGGFEPDVPGALARDRDAPGFDALSLGVSAPAPAALQASEPLRAEPSLEPEPPPVDLDEERIDKARLEQERIDEERIERARLEQERIDKERLRRERDERRRWLEARLAQALVGVEQRQARLRELSAEREAIERELARARSLVDELSADLRQLAAEEPDGPLLA